MDVRPGEIYFVDIPQAQTVGHEQYKRRPFVIVSRLTVNRQSKLVVGVPLTSAKEGKTHPPFRIIIPASEISRDIAFTGPILASVALSDQVRAIDKSRLQEKMGVLSQTALVAVGLGLAYIFDLR